MADRMLSFANDIRPLFTDADVSHMKALGLDLSNHDDVAKRAQGILSTVSAGKMPPPEDGREPWSTAMCDTFRRWMDQGCLP